MEIRETWRLETRERKRVKSQHVKGEEEEGKRRERRI